jgi:hypothetical protein
MGNMSKSESAGGLMSPYHMPASGIKMKLESEAQILEVG